MVALLDLGQGGNVSQETIVVTGVLNADLDESREAVPESRRVYPRRVALNDTLLFKLTDPLAHRGSLSPTRAANWARVRRPSACKH